MYTLAMHPIMGIQYKSPAHSALLIQYCSLYTVNSTSTLTTLHYSLYVIGPALLHSLLTIHCSLSARNFLLSLLGRFLQVLIGKASELLH
jgi:hypothetical protein